MCSSKVNSFSNLLHWYQKKLGSYDQQLWEKTIEERVLHGISSAIPKKVTRVKTDLIDLDLIRGSAFSKCKPKHGKVATTCLGILRVIFFPLYLNWWSGQTSQITSSILLLLYLMQLSSLYIYLNPEYSNDLTCSIYHVIDDETGHEFDDSSGSSSADMDQIPASEVLFPIVMFLILSVIQSHIAASHSLDQQQQQTSHHRQFQSRGQESGSNRRNSDRARGSVSQKVSGSAGGGESGANACNNSNRKSNMKRKKRSPDKQQKGHNGNHRNGVTQSSNAETTDKENDAPNDTKSQAAANGNHKSHRNIGANCQKPSDEESGLEMPEIRDAKSGSSGKSSRRNVLSVNLNSNVNANSISDSNNHAKSSSLISSSRHSRSCERSGKGVDGGASGTTSKGTDDLTGEEGDQEQEDCADLSSLDEISPYSTVNSESWRRYSDIITQRIKSLSESRRFSGNNEDSCRPRSNTVKHSTRCSRFSPVHQQSHSHPDLNISSNDSEASVSPTPLNKGNTELDWPMLNSEGTSEDDEEEPAACSRTSGIGFTHDSDHRYDPMGGSFYYDLESRRCDGGTERVSCAIWKQYECQKVDLSVMDISSAVIHKAEHARYSNEYLYLAFGIAVVLSSIPALFRLQFASKSLVMSDIAPPIPVVVDTKLVLTSNASIPSPSTSDAAPPTATVTSQNAMYEIIQSLVSQVPVPDPGLVMESLIASNCSLLTRYVVIVAAIQRFFMSIFFFFLLCVAEHTYRERFMFAKYFCRLTSARRALGSDLPHFRLNKVRNIKTWLSVRSYLKKHGPQRSVDIIVSGGFILAVCILTFLCVQLLRETDTCSSKLYCWEMVSWNLALGIYILRLMVLGIKTNRKYKSNLSVLITEQINLYLQLEQKPHKKEELTLANHVLKLAADLLKQLETPFKISGFSANHYLYNVTKVVVLSAFSAVLTEMLGFKLKLHKIKL